MLYLAHTVGIAALTFLFANFFCLGTVAFAATLAAPRLCVLDQIQLNESKKRLDDSDSILHSARVRLERDSSRALAQRPTAVTDKTLTPASGDKHDYMSIAPYWWPNPATRSGLPYVRRDGEINPERDQTSDRKRLDNLVQVVQTLALGFFYTGREAYAQRAATLLRGWFIDTETKMNPNLRYAQGVPGRNQGRGAGIIETHDLPELLDAVGLIGSSPVWNQTDQTSLQNWFSAFLTWLRDSPEGKNEAQARNNHGTWYDVQTACFALFAGRKEIAKKIMTDFSLKRIAQQVEPDGRQPLELARTQAWNYSIFNLQALFDAASMADKLGINLWNYESADQRSIRKALDWLVPFATGEKKWPYQQITAFEPAKLAPLLRRASLVFHEPRWERVITKLPKVSGDERWQLLYPRRVDPK